MLTSISTAVRCSISITVAETFPLNELLISASGVVLFKEIVVFSGFFSGSKSSGKAKWDLAYDMKYKSIS